MSESFHGSQWDTLMTVLIEGKRYIQWQDYNFQDEVTTIELLNRNPNVRLVFILIFSAARLFINNNFFLI